MDDKKLIRKLELIQELSEDKFTKVLISYLINELDLKNRKLESE
jgi:hypothetical protein